jgi:ribosomal-protein-alanine N-acetyltransferase
VLAGTHCRLRAYRPDDVDALLAIADDPLVTRWMTAGFPHPYTRADALAWIEKASAEDPTDNFAIEVGGTLAGSVGIRPLHGEHAGTAMFGYWLGRGFWGRGIATDAASALARHALRTRGLRRIEASVFAANGASARVLEKAGFSLEARQRESYVGRDGTVSDALLYARLASDPEP